MTADFVIVGSGLTGAVIARELTDVGKSVLILERRPHLGGNVFDHTHSSGIRVHTYGPHYFRTNDDELWRFVNRFASFYPYEAVIKTWVDGRFENWPIAASYIRRTVGENWAPAFKGVPTNFEEASLALMPQLIYEKFIRGYTEKQWGVPARMLPADLAKRFDVHADDEPRLKRHKYQGLPTNGYAHFISRILAGIQTITNCDYLGGRGEFKALEKVIFTGPIDEFFGFDLGRLKYRGQRREQEFLSDVEYLQPCGQVNNPDPANGPHIRSLEWKQMMAPQEQVKITGTLVTREVTYTPTDPGDYEYPFPDASNARLYREYRTRAQACPSLLICGRLGEYRYYDMDQAIARARLLAKSLLKSGVPASRAI